MRERPARMWRNGRAEDPVFEPAEKLFRRYRLEHCPDGKFCNMGLSFDRPLSFNREKYSEPADTLFSDADADTNKFANWGVLSLQVQHLPAFFPVDCPECHFYPVHAPLENNFAHSDVLCERLSAPGKYQAPRQTASMYSSGTPSCNRSLIEFANISFGDRHVSGSVNFSGTSRKSNPCSYRCPFTPRNRSANVSA